MSGHIRNRDRLEHSRGILRVSASQQLVHKYNHAKDVQVTANSAQQSHNHMVVAFWGFVVLVSKILGICFGLCLTNPRHTCVFEPSDILGPNEFEPANIWFNASSTLNFTIVIVLCWSSYKLARWPSRHLSNLCEELLRLNPLLGSAKLPGLHQTSRASPNLGLHPASRLSTQC